jgi:large subunit ribosomal protein L16
MLVPKRQKFRKQQKGKIRGKAHAGVKVSFGEYGLLAESRGLVTSRQIEAARRAITHYTQRGGRLWIRIFPDKPITKKPPEVGMGAGKGDVYEFVAPVKPGRMLFEMGGVTKDIAYAALRLASYKLNVRSKIVVKSEYNI